MSNYVPVPDYSPECVEVIHSSVSATIVTPTASVELQKEKSSTPFKIECVVVCDKYHDFLVNVLPTNKFLFDKMVVVTSPEDLKTQRVCEFHHVQCIQTDSLRSRWKEFHKGAGINEGLDSLSRDGWVVHLDSDIYLPPQTKIILERANLNPAGVYGVDRFIVKGYEAWDQFRSMPDLQHECDTYVHVKAFPLGTRVTHNFAGGYIPLGFFQMWNPKVSGIYDYPAEHTTAGRGDTLHAERWPRSLRALIPEVVAYHLESNDSRMAVNWNGRTTSEFGPNARGK